MGQIERYGVFALCLVIFLILGIAVWGGEGPRPQEPSGPAAVEPRDVAVADGRDLLTPEPERPAAPAGPQIPARSTFPPDPESGSSFTPEPDPAPVEQRRTYRIKKDDTFDAIARKELGDPRAVERIRELNPGLDSRRLQIGQEIVLPSASAPRTQPPAPAPRTEREDWPKKHKVAPRETLASIARRYYGDERQHTILARANGVRDELKLPVGALLTIPAPRSR
jgi:nucleoid-associated protein YgaU